MRNILVLFALMASVCAANAQTEKIAPLAKQKWHFGNPQGQDSAAGYAQVVKVDNVIYISGTVARDITEAGIRQLYATLEKCLAHFGATSQHVVKENLYTLDLDAMKKMNEVRRAFYKNDFPSATWVQVSRLYTPDLKVEIELIAHLPK
ncbi:RidA family protein [Terrimonas sp. NA20]|uniref:RidA family protein n=1 Tax=Terrimonas ginsenosidimutans TaxID=2908004 RepID=A0ABS9KNJ5_9BACT|nr:RidA family protein [Terrimonas ginsenosidimutans]MCG2613888.1 RidA family protein [Terrimonas ginsenosidimutans]